MVSFNCASLFPFFVEFNFYINFDDFCIGIILSYQDCLQFLVKLQNDLYSIEILYVI